MKGIVKNLKYWGYTLEKIALGMLVWVFFLVALIIIMEGGSVTKEYASELPMYLIMIMFISVVVNAMNGINIYLPLTISLGSTRKDSFVAMQIVQHVILAEFLVVIGACIYYASSEFFEVMMLFIPSVIGGVLVVLTMGNLISTCCLHFGRTVGTIIYVVGLIAVVAVSIGIGITQELGTFGSSGFPGDFLFGPYLLIGGIVLDIVGMLLFYAVLRKQDLQFG